MDSWSLLLIFSIAIAEVQMQGEDVCVQVAKTITKTHMSRAYCINTFDGKILSFYDGRQVDGSHQ